MKAKAGLGHIAYIKIAINTSVPEYYENTELESGIKRGITEVIAMRKKLSKLAKKVLTPFSKTKSAILQSGLRNFKNVFALTALMAIAPSFVFSQAQTSKIQEEYNNVVYLEDLPQTKSTATPDYSKLEIFDPYSQPNIHIKNHSCPKE